MYRIDLDDMGCQHLSDFDILICDKDNDRDGIAVSVEFINYFR